jgi:hypothetical protein
MRHTDICLHASGCAVNVNAEIAVPKDLLTANKKPHSWVTGFEIAWQKVGGQLDLIDEYNTMLFITNLSPKIWWVISGLKTLSSLWTSDSRRTEEQNARDENLGHSKFKTKAYNYKYYGIFNIWTAVESIIIKTHQAWSGQLHLHNICRHPWDCQKYEKYPHLKIRHYKIFICRNSLQRWRMENT